MQKSFKFLLNTFFITAIIGVFLLFIWGFYETKGDNIFRFICFLDCSLILSSFFGLIFMAIKMDLGERF